MSHREIVKGDTVMIIGKPALVKELCGVDESRNPRALIIQDGIEYNVLISDLKLKQEKKDGNIR